MRLLALIGAVLAAGCTDLGGLSTADGPDADSPDASTEAGSPTAGLTLRTQATAAGSSVTTFELTPSVPVEEGDLLFYTIVTTGPGTVQPPAGLTAIASEDDPCVPAKLRMYSRAGTATTPAKQTFQADGSILDLEATLLVFAGSDPVARATSAKVVGGTMFQAEGLVAGSADVAGHVLLTYVASATAGVPEGTSLVAKNGRTTFFSLPVASAGSITPPALAFESHQCGFVAATLFKDR